MKTIRLKKNPVVISCPAFQQLVLNIQRVVASTAQGNFVSLHFE